MTDVCSSSSPFQPSQFTLLSQEHTLNISWQATDNIGLRQFYVGLIAAPDYSGDETEIEYQGTAGQYHYSITRPDILDQGNQFYVSVRAEDLALHVTTVTVGPVAIDLTPPLVNGSLSIHEQQGHVIVVWSEDAFMEEEEGAGPVVINYAIGKEMWTCSGFTK